MARYIPLSSLKLRGNLLLYGSWYGRGQFGFLPWELDYLRNQLENMSSAVNHLKLLDEQFSNTQGEFNKVYDDVESSIQKANFKEDFDEISREKDAFSKNTTKVLKDIIQIGEIILNKFNKLFSKIRSTRYGPFRSAPFILKTNAPIPESVDWRQVGAVSSVKNQRQCPFSLFFAVAGALEGQIFKKTGKLTEVSIRSLMDCTTEDEYEFNACKDMIDQDFNSVNNEIDSKSAYSYETKDGSCRYKGQHITQCKEPYMLAVARIPSGDERSLERAVATIGPIIATIHTLDYFLYYADGIISWPDCGNKREDLNQTILIVGYGKEANGKQYWLAKNSYGPNWGIDGYFKIAKNAGNMCGIATYAIYPEI